jgi:hypothetical protein
MQKPKQEVKDYENDNPWRTVTSSKKKNNRQNCQSTENRNDRRCNDKSTENRNDRRCNDKSTENRNDRRCNRFQTNKPVQYKKNYVTKLKKEPPPIWVVPKLASVILKDELNSNDVSPEKEIQNDNHYQTIVHRIPRIYRHRHSVRNQIPNPNNNISHGVWEYIYYRHILELSDIFSNCAKKLDIDIDSFDFIDIFSHFIRDCSSGEISPNI